MTLRRSRGLPRRTALRPRSAKTERIYEVRRPLVASVLEERPWCEARLPRCQRRSSEVHERLSRARGGSILDRSILVALCHSCHAWITTHPAAAEELGWALPSHPR